jgi:hypothetical protein
MVSLADGTNDAQKTMGVITLALIVNGNLHSGATAPFWVILTCALAISLGTYLGGWRVIRTLGKGLVEIESPRGMAAESASAAVILLSSSFGYSLSTTHVATGSLEHRRADGQRLAVDPSMLRASRSRRLCARPRRRPHRGRDCHPRPPGRPNNNVNEEWTGSAAVAEPEPAAAALATGKQTMSWINLSAIWKIVVFGLLAGAGLPALFATGLFSLSRGAKTQTAGTDSDVVVGGNPVGAVIAVICFLIVLTAIGWGIYEVYQIGHPLPPRLPNKHRRTTLPEPAATSSRGFENMALPPVLSKIIEWLRAGYPEGVPDVDYILLFALLGSELTDREVSAIAEELANESKPESAETIRRAIETVTSQQPKESDVNRVRARLASGGWPLAKPHHL